MSDTFDSAPLKMNARWEARLSSPPRPRATNDQSMMRLVGNCVARNDSPNAPVASGAAASLTSVHLPAKSGRLCAPAAAVRTTHAMPATTVRIFIIDLRRLIETDAELPVRKRRRHQP